MSVLRLIGDPGDRETQHEDTSSFYGFRFVLTLHPHSNEEETVSVIVRVWNFHFCTFSFYAVTCFELYILSNLLDQVKV